MPLAHDSGDIDRAILWAGQEFARREVGNQRDATRLVIAIDEAENSIGMDETRRAVVSKIAAGARKFKVHLVIATQRPTQKALPFLHLLANKFCFQVASARESAFVSGYPGLGCQFLSGSGDAQHVSGANVTRFQVARVSEDDAAKLERAEVARPELEEEDTARILNIPNDDHDRPPGRPAKEIEPRKVAVYLARGPENVTIAWADENLDLRRYNHIAHRDFASEIANELTKLKTQMGIEDE
jgi:DNA segregation ATPase FtsK/SpoIIIE-like protein